MKPPVSEALRRIGWELWDPIGLSHSQGGWIGRPFEDEYDRYTAKAAEMLTDGHRDEEVVDYLFMVQSEWMFGLPPTAIDEMIHAKLLKVVTAIRGSLDNTGKE